MGVIAKSLFDVATEASELLADLANLSFVRFGPGRQSSGNHSSRTYFDHDSVAAITSFLTFNKPFVKAEATNTYDNGANPNFGASRALDPGGGYWVSDGQHGKQEVVSFTGMLKHRHRAKAVRINWAYAPGLARVRVSGDGKHFGDSICWTKTTVPDESYEQVLEFDRPRNVMAVRVDMKEPRAYKYFGINQMSLR
eukprot:g3850.t1